MNKSKPKAPVVSPLSEVKIREKLTAFLSTKKEGIGAVFIPELFIDNFNRRADLVVANGKLSAFEIKSQLDKLDRLQGQIDTYKCFFEKVTIVCAPKHTKSILDNIPNGVGLWEISNVGHFVIKKKAKTNKALPIESWLSFLPVVQIKKLLRSQNISTAGLRPELVEKASIIPLSIVRELVLSYLKERIVDRTSKPLTPTIKERETQIFTEDLLETYMQNLRDGITRTTPRKLKTYGRTN